MEPARERSQEIVAALRDELRARAAGLWRVGPEALEQLAFVAADDMPKAVVRAFAEATRSVPLDRADLGIVQAANGGAVAVSHATAPPSATGSGHWLRAFGAARSVAVPLSDGTGTFLAVLSVALGSAPPGDEMVAARVRDWGQALAAYL